MGSQRSDWSKVRLAATLWSKSGFEGAIRWIRQGLEERPEDRPMETKRHYGLSLVVEGRLIIGEESGRERIFEANQLFESSPGYRCWTRIDPDLDYRDLLVHCDSATFEILRTLDVLPMGELISGQRVGAGARLAYEALGGWLERKQSCVWSQAVVELIGFFEAIKRDVHNENVQVGRQLILDAARRLESRLEEQLSIE